MTGTKIKMGDVARLSGVSRATVDRVLNNRPGVRPETSQKVERALRDLGYAASRLDALQRHSLTSVCILVSKGSNPFFQVIYDGVNAALEQPEFAGLDANIVSFDPYDPATLVTALDNVPVGVDAVVTVGCDVPEVARAIDDLVKRGTRVVTMISDVPQSRRTTYIGQDNYAAGRTAARLMAGFVGQGSGAVGVFLGHYQFRHLMDRMAGFHQTLGLMRPELNILQPPPYGSDPDRALAAIAELDSAGSDLKGVYITGGGQPVILESLAACEHEGLVVLGHEVSPESRAALLDGRFTALLGSDMTMVGERALHAATSPVGFDPAPCPINVHFPENLPYDATR